MRTDIAELYDNLYLILVGYAARIVGIESEAHDIVQNVFVSMWEGEKYKEIGWGEKWLFCCVRNECIDILRRRKRYRVVELENHLHEIEDAPYNKPLTSKDEQVYREIERLPIQQRRIFKLAYVEQKTLEEIVEITRLKIPTVKNQLRSSIIRLRKRLNSTYQGIAFHTRLN